MININIEVNEKLFVIYVGLTASGYELSNKEDADLQSLIASIRSLTLDNDTLQFFRQARTDKYPVNPYWPRGSALSSASFFIDSGNQIAIKDYLAFERSSGASNEFEKEDFQKWISTLPVYLKAIKSHADYPPLWAKYQSIIGSRVAGYQSQLKVVSNCLTDFGIIDIPDRQLIFVPNLLQLHSMADFVLKSGRLYVITTHPVMSTIIHECLHPFVAKYKRLLSRFASSDNFTAFTNETKMKTMGYQWDESIQAKIRVLEESIVRGLSIVITGDNESAEGFCRINDETGFVLVPSILEYAKKQRPNLIGLRPFIKAALEFHLTRSF